MQKCTDREDDTENCTITAQCQMLELISCWNIKKKKNCPFMKRRNQKVILKHSQEHSSKLQVLSLWRHRICSLSNCPQRANQEIILLEGVSEGEQGSFTNVCREAAEKCKHKKHRISSRCCMQHTTHYHPSILNLWRGASLYQLTQFSRSQD